MKNSGTVRFLMNGNPVEIDFHARSEFTPTTTLLQYLRCHPDLVGTKEGCAEGDCGACTVVLVSPESGSSEKVLAIDSCLVFLPMIHGKAVITVEHLGTLDHLHPVQTAMVEHDGSQCGYCTPGFVMSLFALHQNDPAPDKAAIADALTGNLCRCTGYRSIMDAACNVKPQQNGMTGNIAAGLGVVAAQPLAIMQELQKYFQPHSLEEALRLRNMYPMATLITGATDVALKVTKNDQLIEEIMDLSNVPELRILEKSDQSITFGAGLSLEEVKKESKKDFVALYECLAVFGSLQIRNLATLGGNIISASPIGDTPPILMAYGATVNLANHESSRSIPLTEFITGYRETLLQKNEILISVTVPRPKTNCHTMWYKISKRKDLDISSVSGGFYLELDQQQIVTDIKLFFGGMAAKTSLAIKTGECLVGKTWTRDNIRQAVGQLSGDFSTISDARASAEGRQVMAQNLLWKFWTKTNGTE